MGGFVVRHKAMVATIDAATLIVAAWITGVAKVELPSDRQMPMGRQTADPVSDHGPDSKIEPAVALKLC